MTQRLPIYVDGIELCLLLSAMFRIGFSVAIPVHCYRINDGYADVDQSAMLGSFVPSALGGLIAAFLAVARIIIVRSSEYEARVDEVVKTGLLGISLYLNGASCAVNAIFIATNTIIRQNPPGKVDSCALRVLKVFIALISGEYKLMS